MTTKASFLATSVLAAALLQAGGAGAETINLRIGAGHPPNATWTTGMREFFQKEVSDRVLAKTGDTVTWTEAYGGFVCKLGECLEAVESGLLDVAEIESIFEPAKLQAQNFFLFVPFSTPDPRVNAGVINLVYAAVPEPGTEWSIDLGERTARLQDAALKKMADGGVTLIGLTDAQRTAWAMSLGNLPKARHDEIMASGAPGEAIYEYLRLLTEAGHTFPRDWAAER